MIYGPCDPWPAIFPCDVMTESPAVTGAAVDMASFIVDGLSGRQFGLCTVTLRPCRDTCTTWDDGWAAWHSGVYYPTPSVGWYWPMTGCVTCGDKCSCSAREKTTLPYPVHDVIQVKVDGSPLVTGAYRVDDQRELVRVDGKSWPLCNDLTLPDTAVGTWNVTARYGLDVPIAGQYAVGEMACELMRAFSGEDCRLPKSATHVVRQGVRIQLSDLHSMFAAGRTGLYLTDLFVTTVNPGGSTTIGGVSRGLRRRSRVFSIDTPTPTRTGT